MELRIPSDVATVPERLRGIPILLVEQNAHKALEVAHRAYVLETGSIVKEGTGSELLHSPDVQRAYLGM